MINHIQQKENMRNLTSYRFHDYRPRSPRWDNGPIARALPTTTWWMAAAWLAVVVIGLVIAYLVMLMAVEAATAQQPTAMRGDPQPVDLVLEDQFDRKADLAALRGQVVILVYGDRKASDVCRQVGESLHVCWHPSAKGQPPAKAQSAPVAALENLPPGRPSPNVVVLPVASCGKIPGPIRGVIRSQIAKGSPDVVVWLDFDEKLKTAYGECAGEANLLVFDVKGRLRGRINGTPDQPQMDRLVKVVQDLRYEAVR